MTMLHMVIVLFGGVMRMMVLMLRITLGSINGMIHMVMAIVINVIGMGMGVMLNVPMFIVGSVAFGVFIGASVSACLLMETGSIRTLLLDAGLVLTEHHCA